MPLAPLSLTLSRVLLRLLITRKTIGNDIVSSVSDKKNDGSGKISIGTGKTDQNSSTARESYVRNSK